MEVAVIEAYSRLKALKQNLPPGHAPGKYVAEFHDILDALERTSGTNLASFRVPGAEVRLQPSAVQYHGEATRYSDEPACERAYFDMKLDGVLTMFELILTSGEKDPIGFNPGRR